ncbi:HAL/PAL/TAL family ammonia-lyase [Brevibacterium gallinarum]|uniref:Histidine ammonia-lyase n=1 Tax=Brevibacterium gallinarum TaxID=2762220 RepID=A0ABR8WXP5_9MICO|nr:histidine ammonia-lyase [Brevibacterium gallinarum]MBD8021863.1 histidine ammonia-lyase [Brevibacterium gallinarum]
MTARPHLHHATAPLPGQPAAAEEFDGPVLTLGEADLSLAEMVDVARHRRRIALAPAAQEACRESRAWLDDVIDRMKAGEDVEAIYSVNTGFGSLAGRQAFPTAGDAAELSRRLILADASGIGRLVDEEVVRATMLIRIQSLIAGHSAISWPLVEGLVAMLNHDVWPAVPEYGSLGASGDLIPLAHIALVLTGPPTGEDKPEDSGEAVLDGQIVPGTEAMAAAGIDRVPVGAKDGLALLNGTSFSLAQTALAAWDATTLLETTQVTASMTIEALLGFGDAFIDELHTARKQPGQIAVAARMRELMADSKLITGSRDADPERQPPQDAYSLRCIPQVFGPVADTLDFAIGVIERELNAATDNPLVFPQLSRPLKAVSGGNFHAEYVAFAADFLSIAVTEIGNITERRVFRLDDGTLNRGLPDMLVDSEQVGMDCGFMLPQYLAAALVSDCKTLAHPDSVDSIPTSANQEDHVSMANNAGRHLRQIVANIEAVVGIELLMAVQALELRVTAGRPDGRAVTREEISSAGRRVMDMLRSTTDTQGRAIAHLTQDVVLYPQVRTATALVKDGAVVRAADGQTSTS